MKGFHGRQVTGAVALHKWTRMAQNVDFVCRIAFETGRRASDRLPDRLLDAPENRHGNGLTGLLGSVRPESPRDSLGTWISLETCS